MADEEIPLIPETKNNEDEDKEETRLPGSFDNPVSSSTPMRQGQQFEMQTRQHEQSGLTQPEKSYEETSSGQQTQSSSAFLKFFPNMNKTLVETFSDENGRIKVKMIDKKTSYYLFTTERGTSSKRLNPSLTKEIRRGLGDSIFGEVEENEKELAKKQKELKENESMAKYYEKVKNEMDEIRNQIKQIDEKKTDLEDKHGPLNKEEIEKLKLQKKTLKNNIKKKERYLINSAKQQKMRQN